MKSILTLNLGSTSVKFSAFSFENQELEIVFSGLVDSVLKNPILKIKSHLDNKKFTEKFTADNKFIV